MTSLPELVAAFHSLVGLAAVCVAAAAFFEPAAYGIGTPGNIGVASLIEMSIGTAIGAITFTGSIIAFAKLQEVMTGSPIQYPGQQYFNGLLAIGALILCVMLAMSPLDTTLLWGLIGISLLLGVLLALSFLW